MVEAENKHELKELNSTLEPFNEEVIGSLSGI